TQMFFDNQKYFEFVDKCRKIGITVPIIAGIKPFDSKRQLETLPKMFYIDLPEDLVDEIEKCKTDEDVKKAGIEWAIQQSKELKKAGVPCLHYYTMSKSKTVTAIAREVF